jgi:glycerol uptake facilitator protein
MAVGIGVAAGYGPLVTVGVWLGSGVAPGPLVGVCQGGVTLAQAVAVITTVGNITGSSINPARTFGPYLGDLILGGTNLWNYYPIYVIGPIVGAILAAFIYQYISSEEKLPAGKVIRE